MKAGRKAGQSGLLRVFVVVVAAALVSGAVGCSLAGEKSQVEPSELGTATKAYNAGDFSGAEKSLAKALDESPTDRKALELMALVQAAQGKNKQAISQYGRMVEADPDDHASWYRMALLERVVGDSKKSETHLATALKLEPGNRGYADELARTKMGLGKYEEAAVLWGVLAESDEVNKEGQKELLVLQGQAYQSAKDYKNAKKAFRAALKLDPKDDALEERVASFE